MRPTKQATCHPDRKHVAKGLCRSCSTAAHKAANPGKWKEYERRSNLKRSFGITPEQFDEMLRAQGFRCGCCGSTRAGGKSNTMHVDHDHKTGKIRGLLCHSCNTGIGSLGDDLQGLRRAVAYLERSALG